MPKGIYKRKPLTEKHKRNISNAHVRKVFGFQKGHKDFVPPKSRKIAGKKISKALKGNTNSLGRIISEEHKRRIGDAHRGKPLLKNLGSNNSNWKGGITPLVNKIRNHLRYKQWVSEIYQRDYWTCQKCNKKKGIKLIAHHKPPNTFSNLLEKYRITTILEALNCKELWNINHGITWCRKCHVKFHKSKKVLKGIGCNP